MPHDVDLAMLRLIFDLYIAVVELSGPKPFA